MPLDLSTVVSGIGIIFKGEQCSPLQSFLLLQNQIPYPQPVFQLFLDSLHYFVIFYTKEHFYILCKVKFIIFYYTTLIQICQDSKKLMPFLDISFFAYLYSAAKCSYFTFSWPNIFFIFYRT